MQAFWQTHRPFILRVAAGLALFLILMNLSVGYRTGGQGRAKAMQNELLGISERLRDLDGRHQLEQRNADALEARVEELLSRLSLTDNAEITPPEAGDPGIDFPQRKAQLWSSFTDRADRIHLGYPRIRDFPFDERSDLSDEEWADRYGHLEVVRRVLDAGVEAQLDRFEAILPEAVVSEPISDDAELTVWRYPVTLRVVGAYPEVLGFLRSFQADRKFLSMELVDVVHSNDGPDKIQAEIRAAGIDLGAAREEKGKRPAGRRRRP